MKHAKWSLLLAASLAQLAIPLAMIWKREQTLREGSRYLFRVAPVDPYDVLRGRYVQINIERQLARLRGDPIRRARGYALLGRDSNGWGVVNYVVAKPPKDSVDYVRAFAHPSDNPSVYHVFLPVDRFYLPEREALEAEQIVQSVPGQIDSPAAVAVVRVYRGLAVVEELLIEGTPIRRYLRERNAEAPPKHL